MPLVDPRTDRLVAVWAIGTADGIVDAIYTASPAVLSRYLQTQILGRLFYVRADSMPDGIPIRSDSITRINIKERGENVLGYAYSSPQPGMRDWQLFTSIPTTKDQFLGYGWEGPRTNGFIHSARFDVTSGVNALSFNLAAGGYLQSWEVGGVEILNRNNSWGRGLQNQLEWTDVSNGRLSLHRPAQAACLFNSGLGALGSVLLSIEQTQPLIGGPRIRVETIPLELDPSGATGVAGASTDHGGDESHPVLWRDIRCITDIYLDWNGITGLHRVDVTWQTPFAVQSGWFDCAAHTGLCVNGDHDEMVVYDLQSSTPTDVTAQVDATDFQRFSVSTANTFEDNAASPLTASTLPSGFGGVYARNTATDLTVFLAGRLHVVNPAELDVSLADVPRGTQATYMTNRSGSTGLDGDQFALLGLDSSLSYRWYDEDQVRRIPNGQVTYTRWLSIGNLADALAQARLIPLTY